MNWLDRHPLVVALVACAGLLGVAQTAVVLWQIQSPGSGGFAMAIGSALRYTAA